MRVAFALQRLPSSRGRIRKVARATPIFISIFVGRRVVYKRHGCATSGDLVLRGNGVRLGMGWRDQHR